MRILIACEFSGAVRRAFAALGHDVLSCDLLPSEDDSPYHYQGDVFDLLREGGHFDLMVAHPPCTHLAVSGAKHFPAKRADGRQQAALEFVQALLDAPVPRIALENPVSVISTMIRKPDQIIQPWQFGDEATKTTCLWLKGLPKLAPTKIVGVGEHYTTPSGKRLPKWYSHAPIKDRAKIRSKTFQGIADAMAAQWGTLTGDTHE